jgi:hypothetical protein
LFLFHELHEEPIVDGDIFGSFTGMENRSEASKWLGRMLVGGLGNLGGCFTTFDGQPFAT